MANSYWEARAKLRQAAFGAFPVAEEEEDD